LDLKVAYNQLLFWVNKAQGLWYPPEELDAIVHKGQLSFYEDCFDRYGVGQRLTDALAPFKKPSLPFTTSSTGLLTTPDDYLDLISIYTTVNGVRRPCPLVNEDEVTYRVNSQVIPNTINNPFAEITKDWDFQLYPQVQHTGAISYFRRPVAPVFVYTLVSGRVIVYDQGASTQLEWADTQIQSLLIWTLRSIGINVGEKDIQEFSDQVNKENLLSAIKI
jgi:hypothetical protein